MPGNRWSRYSRTRYEKLSFAIWKLRQRPFFFQIFLPCVYLLLDYLAYRFNCHARLVCLCAHGYVAIACCVIDAAQHFPGERPGVASSSPVFFWQKKVSAHR